MNSLEINQFLSSFINYEKRVQYNPDEVFKLDRIKAFLDLLGNPQKNLKCIHVAGTKGKGSCCSFMASILQEAGYKVGLYTSPHVRDVNERIRVLSLSASSNDEFFGKISNEQLSFLIQKILPHLEEKKGNCSIGYLTYFEILTVLAIMHFVESNVDVAIFETGLGGRLDATNVFDSLICVITSISMEHTKQLGNTIGEIAFEKAAIIKNKKQKVVLAFQDQKAEEVILDRCRQFDIYPHSLGKDLCYTSRLSKINAQTFDVQGLNNRYDNLSTRLLGEHQVINATLAIGVVELLQNEGFFVNREAIKKGVELTAWPCRFEIVSTCPFVVLDMAHNVDSFKALINTIDEVLPGREVTFVLGFCEDKDLKGIAKQLKGIAKNIILTKADHPRSYLWKDEDASNLFSGESTMVCNNINEAIEKAHILTNKNDVIVIAGSIFVAAHAREFLNVSV